MKEKIMKLAKKYLFYWTGALMFWVTLQFIGTDFSIRAFMNSLFLSLLVTTGIFLYLHWQEIKSFKDWGW